MCSARCFGFASVIILCPHHTSFHHQQQKYRTIHNGGIVVWYDWMWGTCIRRGHRTLTRWIRFFQEGASAVPGLGLAGSFAKHLEFQYGV